MRFIGSSTKTRSYVWRFLPHCIATRGFVEWFGNIDNDGSMGRKSAVEQLANDVGLLAARPPL